jgi:hypothetical protein
MSGRDVHEQTGETGTRTPVDGVDPVSKPTMALIDLRRLVEAEFGDQL